MGKKRARFFVPSNTGRQRLNIHGSLNIRTKEVITLFQNTVNQEGTLELLKELRKMSGEREMYIISDNARYYRAKSIQEYAASNNITMNYLPVYSPNLNIIERLWKFFGNEVLSKCYYHFDDFKAKCKDFFANLSQQQLDTLFSTKFQIIRKTLNIIFP